MKFNDIPQISHANYRVNIPWSLLERALQGYFEDYQLNIEPDFQRNHVWTLIQQTRYIEWVLRGGKSGRELLFNCPGWGTSYQINKMVLVDGLQRLTAVRKFLNNDIPIFGDNYFKDFEDRICIGGPDFVFYVNNLPTRKQVLQWYLDINSGGTPHTEEEIEKVRKLLEEEKSKKKKVHRIP